jgi:hypothetical protein
VGQLDEVQKGERLSDRRRGAWQRETGEMPADQILPGSVECGEHPSGTTGNCRIRMPVSSSFGSVIVSCLLLYYVFHSLLSLSMKMLKARPTITQYS